jgi:hypothetical protein
MFLAMCDSAVEIATKLKAKIESVASRFAARCKKCGPVDVLQLRYCDVAFKLLYGIIRRVSGSVLFRMQELLRQVRAWVVCVRRHCKCCVRAYALCVCAVHVRACVVHPCW